jgi:aspartate kinase
MLDQISFEDAIELAYFGAGVIHPKTIQPIRIKNIPLFVKSFIHPENPGTVINKEQNTLPVPSFIFKVNQVLISLTSRDFSFIMEDHLAEIFGLFAKFGVKINFMQNSAVSFSVCVTNDHLKTSKLLLDLAKTFNVDAQENLELITIRYFNNQTIDRLLENKKLLLEFKAGETIQFVVAQY